MLASVRVLNRLELLGETLRATLNELAAVAPGWLREVAPEAWYERDARRIADGRLPRAAAEREADAHTVGEDGVARLDRLGGPQTPEGLRQLPMVKVLRPVWARPFERKDAASPGGGVRLRPKEEPPPPATEPIESPDDPQARFRTRAGVGGTGDIVPLSESGADDAVHRLTHAMTTPATGHEARCTTAIHEALAGQGLTPSEHLVEAGDVEAGLLVRRLEDHGIDLVGPPRVTPAWPTKVAGGDTIDRFESDWEPERVRCPQGKLSSAWSSQVDPAGLPSVSVRFRKADGATCPARPLGTRAESEALRAARQRLSTTQGRPLDARPAGVAGRAHA